MSASGDADFKIGDRVVYPNQGVCRVVGTQEMEIGGQRETFIKLAREEDQATVMVPKGRLAKVGVRRLADASDVKKVFQYLSSPVEGPELDWKVRARSHGERMTEGGLIGLAQVVKGLATLADLRPLPPKERELYDNARHLLVEEIGAATQLAMVSAEDAVDLALYPPGVERKKPELKLEALLGGGEGDDLGLGEDLGFEAEEEAPAEEAEAAVGEEGEGEEAGEEEEAAEEKPKKGRKPKAAGEEKPAKAPKAKKEPKAKAEKPPKAEKAPAKEAKEKKPKAVKEPKAKAEKPEKKPAKAAAKPKPKKK